MSYLSYFSTFLLREAAACVRNRDGNVSLMFGLALLPILAGVGAAIDYSRASNARARLSAAVDATVLALARRAPQLTDTQLRAEAETVFKAVLGARGDLSSLPLVVNRSDRGIAITAAGVMPTSFMKLFGVPTMRIDTLAAAGAGVRRKVELALVLDNTGSMQELNKMAELKKASRNLIDAVERVSPTGSGSIKVALVPFDTQVKLNPSANRNALWLATSDNAAERTFDNIRGAMTRRSDWTGCVTDRGSGYNDNTRPAVIAIAASLHPAVGCNGDANLAMAQPLSDNWASLRSTIDAMKPAGATNITIGAQFGFAALSPAGGPLGGGVPFGTPDVDKYMILLTDGDNTKDRFIPDQMPLNERARVMNPRTTAMCSDIKSRAARTDARGRPIPDVKIFTVRVIAGSRDLLRTCATDPSMYKEVSNAREIDAVFKDILEEITRLQLTM